MASLTHVLERMQKKEKPLWHLHRSSEIESVDELQFASGRWMKPIQHFPKPKTEERQKSRQTPSTAVSPVAIHHGNHGTYEPARGKNHHRTKQSTADVQANRYLKAPHPKDRIRGNDGQDEALPTLQANSHKPPRLDPMERRHRDCNLRRTQPQEQSPTWRRHAPTRTCNPTRWNPMQGSHLLS